LTKRKSVEEEDTLRTNTVLGRNKRPAQAEESDGLASRLTELLVGQPEAIETIIPYVQMHQAGLAPEGRPVGVVLLLGPTGTGKTRSKSIAASSRWNMR
jgi:ATP-dependent Clp protease ATP-binding subunit ClpA